MVFQHWLVHEKLLSDSSSSDMRQIRYPRNFKFVCYTIDLKWALKCILHRILGWLEYGEYIQFSRTIFMERCRWIQLRKIICWQYAFGSVENTLNFFNLCSIHIHLITQQHESILEDTDKFLSIIGRRWYFQEFSERIENRYGIGFFLEWLY